MPNVERYHPGQPFHHPDIAFELTYGALERVYLDMPLYQGEVFQQALADAAEGPGGADRLTVLNTIFAQSDSSNVRGRLFDTAYISEARQQVILTHPSMQGVAESLADAMLPYRFELGILLAAIPFDLLSENLRDIGGVSYSGAAFQVHPYHLDKAWYLCDEAEQRLDEAMRLNKTMLINGRMLMKGVGRPAAVALSSFATDRGTVIRGNWYALEDWYASETPEARAKIYEAAQRGETRIDLAEGTWSLLRAVEDPFASEDSYLHDLQEYAKNLPEHVTPWRWERIESFPVD